ncbi:type III secretion system inner membrane ring lipoprotein SctJ [Paraburkholderia phosphatilytica]|uniref:type III secretion system inner membrane ring lipoprotein SctJ n=1 Tax=Paraburkholderia phosphatilytica TaxID=2282883 RepID=UPI000E51876E|nr:type III secretion inner membrane ring lipoprotein SctJ [Paraburkholderia phosphatilytica]
MTKTGRWVGATLLLACLAGCNQELYSGLEERDANQMISVLADAGIGASKENVETRDGGSSWQVDVDGSQVSEALNVLRAHGLPHQQLESLGQIFQQQGLVETPAEERVRYIYGVQQELSRTLDDVDGVVVAHVQVVIPENDPLSDKVKPSSASVYIKYRPGVDLQAMAPMVKDLVTHSIEGLAYDNVSLFLQAETAPPQAAGGFAGSALPGLLLMRSPFAWLLAALLALTLCVVALLGARRGVFGSRIATALGGGRNSELAASGGGPTGHG